MGKETSEFDSWLQTVEAAVESLGLIDSLDAVASLVRQKVGVNLWFVEVLGRRWSYLAGQMPEQSPQADARRIVLEKHIGLVSDSWKEVSEGDRTKLVAFLNQLISERSVASTK